MVGMCDRQGDRSNMESFIISYICDEGQNVFNIAGKIYDPTSAAWLRLK
jgi:hypothetical protein